MAPTTRSGRPLKHLGRGYFVLLDALENEVSDRAPGEVWLAIEARARMSLILHPDETDTNGMVVLAPRAGAAHFFAVALDDIGVVVVQPTGALVLPGGTFHINWNPMLDAMA